MSNRQHPRVIDLYALLGVAPDASSAQINTAYRQLARTLHPDSAHSRGGDPATLRLVIEAHQILSNPRERQRYDSTRSPAPPTRSRSAPVTACGVCGGTGTIARACDRCAGTGQVLTNSPWLQTPLACPVCDGRRSRPLRCGACGANGRTSRRSSRSETSAST